MPLSPAELQALAALTAADLVAFAATRGPSVRMAVNDAARELLKKRQQ